MMVLGMIGLCSALSLSAQDDAIEKKPEGVAVEQPEDSAKPARGSEQEGTGRHWREGEDAVMVGNDFVLQEDEVAKDVVVVSGNATIDGRVKGDLVVVGGTAKVSGRVDGELVVIMGLASLGPSAEIGRDVTVVGGTLAREPGSR